MTNEKFKAKINNISKFAAAFLSIYLIIPAFGFIRNAVSGFIEGWNSYDNPAASENAPTFLEGLLSFPIVILWIASIIICIRMLLRMRKNDTPFTEQNGRSLRNIGIVLMILEPLNIIYNISSNGGVFPDLSGILFSVGIVMLCFSMVFRYGTQLQQENDDVV